MANSNIINENTDVIVKNENAVLKKNDMFVFDEPIKSVHANKLLAKIHYEKASLFFKDDGYYLSLIPYNYSSRIEGELPNIKTKNFILPSKYNTESVLLEKSNYFDIKHIRTLPSLADFDKYLKDSVTRFAIENNTSLPKTLFSSSETQTPVDFPKNNTFEPNNNFTKTVYESINNSLKHANTNFNRIYSILNESIEYNGKPPKLIFKTAKEQIYNIILNGPERNNMQKLFSDNWKRLSFDSMNPIIENWIKYNKNTCITSRFYENKGTIFELNNFFVQVLNDEKEPVIRFLHKDKDMTLEKYYKLNDEGRSFYAAINNQFVTVSDTSYFISTVTEGVKNGKVLFDTGLNEYHGNGKINISENELYQLVKLLSRLEKQNFDFKEKKYFGISDTPFLEYLLNKNDTQFVNSNTFLENGVGRDFKTNQKIYAEDLIKDGRKILDQFELRQEVEGSQNLLSGKWKEISQYKYDTALKSSSHFKHQDNGFFSSYPHYGDLRYFYQKYNDKYYMSLQRLCYDRDYIMDSLVSASSRIEPLEKKFDYYKNYLQEYSPKYYESFSRNGKIPSLDDISYEMLKSAGFTVTKITKTGLDGIDGKEYEDKRYSYDIRNQTSEKSSRNKYDQFACKYINEFSLNENTSLNSMKKLLDNFSFKGDTLSLAKNLMENKKDKYKNYETLENILHNGSSQFPVSSPPLQSISSYCAANNINIDSYITKPDRKEIVNLDNINTDAYENNIKRSRI